MNTVTGIKNDLGLRVATFTATVCEGSKRAGQVAIQGGVYNPVWVPADSDIDQAVADYMTQHGFSEIRAWFEDGGTQYAANYPGKDITGVRFEKGAQVLRKMKQFLAI